MRFKTWGARWKSEPGAVVTVGTVIPLKRVLEGRGATGVGLLTKSGRTKLEKSSETLSAGNVRHHNKPGNHVERVVTTGKMRSGTEPAASEKVYGVRLARCVAHERTEKQPA